MNDRLIAAALIWAGMAVKDAIISTKEGVRTFTDDELIDQSVRVVDDLSDNLDTSMSDAQPEWALTHKTNCNFCWVVAWKGTRQQISSIRIAQWSESAWTDDDGYEHGGWCDDSGAVIDFRINDAIYSKPLASFANTEAARRDFMRFITA